MVRCSSLKCATVISYLIKDNLVFLSNNALSFSPLVALGAGQVMVWYLEDQLGQCFIVIVFSIWSFDISMVLFIHIVIDMSVAHDKNLYLLYMACESVTKKNHLLLSHRKSMTRTI